MTKALPVCAQEVFDNWNVYLRPVDREDFKGQLAAIIEECAAAVIDECAQVADQFNDPERVANIVAAIRALKRPKIK